jgi:membrane glycosyltransferase
MLLLFLPKVISVIVTLGHAAEAEKFGGRVRLAQRAARNGHLSTLLAPINMMFNAKFVLFTLLGQGVGWVSQRRGPARTAPTGARRSSPTGGRRSSASSGACRPSFCGRYFSGG